MSAGPIVRGGMGADVGSGVGGRLARLRANLPRPSRRMAAWLVVLVLVMAAGVTAWLYQQWNGLRVTNMRNTFMWGNYILFFMFFVGLSAGGLIVASSGRLFGVARFRPIVRLAVLEATVAITLAGTFIIPDLGRPERLLNIFLYANPTSPMVWDVTIVLLYLGMSATYVWLYTRHDLAARGSVLALGTHATDAGHRRDDRLKGALAWVALPAAILLHSITAWIFGLQIGRTFWYTALMAPMFIASALVSGLALVILLALAVRAAGRLRFDDDLVSFLAGLLAVFIATEGFFLFAEVLTAAYPGSPAEADAIWRLLTGPYLVPFLGETAFGLVLPFAMLVVPRLRRRPGVVALASVIAIVGIFAHRLDLLLNALSYPTIALPPGVSIGIEQQGTNGLPGLAFAGSYWYVPSAVEWLVVAGVLASGALLFTLAAWYLPLQEDPSPPAE